MDNVSRSIIPGERQNFFVRPSRLSAITVAALLAIFQSHSALADGPPDTCDDGYPPPCVQCADGSSPPCELEREEIIGERCGATCGGPIAVDYGRVVSDLGLEGGDELDGLISSCENDKAVKNTAKLFASYAVIESGRPKSKAACAQDWWQCMAKCTDKMNVHWIVGFLGAGYGVTGVYADRQLNRFTLFTQARLNALRACSVNSARVGGVLAALAAGLTTGCMIGCGADNCHVQ